MQEVELIYDADCPNVARARAVLREAFLRLGRDPAWIEWDRSAAATPVRFRKYGSPTILIDGRDVDEAACGPGHASCRLYDDGTGHLTGVPPIARVLRALRG